MSIPVDPRKSQNLPPWDLINNVGELLNTGRHVFKDAENNHAYRYVKLVETSHMGHDCKYALASQRLWIDSGQREATLNLLLKLRDAINDILIEDDSGSEEETK